MPAQKQPLWVQCYALVLAGSPRPREAVCDCQSGLPGPARRSVTSDRVSPAPPSGL